jgi:protein O-mannosyl-transferase
MLIMRQSDNPESRKTSRSSSGDPATRAGRKLTGVTYFVLFLLTCLPYLNTLANGFVYDDVDQILYNPFVLSVHHLKQIFTLPVWAFKANSSIASYFRPLMSLSFLALHQVYGFVPIGYHIFCVTLAGVITCLVYAVTRRWTEDEPVSISAALIFALHPVHSEAVAWISDVTDLEVTVFILVAFWCYLALSEPLRNQLLNRCGAAFCLALALLSKEIAVVFPPLAMVFEHFYREDRSQTTLATKVRRYIPLWAVVALYFVYRRIALGGFTAISESRKLGMVETIAAGFQLFAKHLAKLFWPYRLQAFYVYALPSHLWDPWVLCGVASVIALAVLAIVLRRLHPVVSFGIVWYIAFIGLALNVRWLAKAAFAERYLFLPSLGFAWAFAFYGVRLWRQNSSSRSVLRPLLAAAACILAILSFVRIYTRNRDWHDDLTLYERTLQQEPTAVYIRVDLGGVYWAMGQRQRAVEEWQLAHQTDPKFYLPLIDLGVAATATGDFASANSCFQQAAELSPAASSSYVAWADLKEKQGDLRDAEVKLLHAIKLAPYDTEAHSALARLYLKQGRLNDAAEQLLISARLIPNSITWDELGDLYLRLGEVDQAESAYLSSLDANPYDTESQVGLGQVYEKRGETNKALREYQKGLKNNPNNPIALAGLARLQTGKR